MGGSCDKVVDNCSLDEEKNSTKSSKSQNAKTTARAEARADKKKQRESARRTKRGELAEEEPEEPTIPVIPPSNLPAAPRSQPNAPTAQPLPAAPPRARSAVPAVPAQAAARQPVAPKQVARPAVANKPKPPGSMVVSEKYMSVQMIMSMGVLDFERQRVSNALKGVFGASPLHARRSALVTAIMELRQKCETGALTPAQYIERVQKMHKRFGLLFKKSMLSADDAAVAKQWIPLMEAELSEAEASFQPIVLSVNAVAAVPAPAAPSGGGNAQHVAAAADPTLPPVPAQTRPPAAPAEAPAAKHVSPVVTSKQVARPAVAKKPEPPGSMVVSEKYMSVQMIMSMGVLDFERQRVSNALKGVFGSSPLHARRSELVTAIMELRQKCETGALTPAQYIERVQKMHKRFGLLFKKSMLSADDAAVAKQWVPLMEAELSEAEALFQPIA